MCGIAGFHGEGGKCDLVRMTDALSHRGPDGDGFYEDQNTRIFLGHRRLAVIDIAGGAQPMSNDDGTILVVFNGEIYNHRTLRKTLEREGQVFKSDHSDTEVLVRGYEFWGEAVVEHLDGMFAFAIYDAKRQRLILGRDRFGEKPLFYLAGPHGLVFASELQALRHHPAGAARGLDGAALQKLFAYTFIPGVLTPFEGIRKLQAGSLLVYDCVSQTFRERRYWRFCIEPDDPPPGTVDDWVDEIKHLVRRAVESRLESDVPLGVFLSGGIDSSSIAMLAADFVGGDRVSSFTIAFNEASYDESAYAEIVAKAIGSRHFVDTCDADYMYRQAPEILGRVFDLLGDPSLIPTYMLAKATRRHVTVALSGDGGDELFGGYDPMKVVGLARAYDASVPKPVHQALAHLWARLPQSERYMSFEFKVARALRGLSHNPNVWNPIWLGAFSPQEIAAAFENPLPTEELYSEAIEEWDRSSSANVLDRTLEFFTNLYLTDDILVKSDRAGMLNSLEVRAPFLDRDLVDFVRRLPSHVKVRRGETKWILKQAMNNMLPREIVRRRKKGFGIPVSAWLRQMGTLRWNPVAGLNNAEFERLSMEHQSGTRDHRGALWCRLVLDSMIAAADTGQRDESLLAASAGYRS